MPAKRQAQRQKNLNKQRSKGMKVTGVTNTPSIIPSMFRGKMFYSTTATMSCAIGALTTTVFRCNSIYDPDLTNVGTAVSGYASLSALYNRYRVLGCKIHLTLSNVGTTPLTAFAAVNPVNTVGTSFATAMAQRHVWDKALAPTTGTSCVEHVISVPIHKIYGVPASQVRQEDDFAGLTSGNPNNVVYLHVGFYNYSGAAAPALYTVRMEFDVVWSLPLETSQ